MWPFTKPNLNDLQSKAYLVYHEFGPKLRIPRDERLFQKFRSVDRTTIKIWLDQFKSIDKEISEFVGLDIDFDQKALEKHLKSKFPFLNKKALNKATFMGWWWIR